MSHTDPRNASFDYARLIAVVGIIWFHAKAPGALVGYSGLAFFTVMVVLFAVPQIMDTRAQLHRAAPFLRYAAARGQRLLVPWFIASAFYGGLKVLEVIGGAPLKTEFSAEMWITGTALHLWFLPFAFAVCIALWPFGRWVRQIPVQIWSWLSLICTGVALIGLACAQTAQLPVPFAQWVYACPVVMLGVAFTLCRRNQRQTLTVFGIFACTALALDLTHGLLEVCIASLALLVCRVFPSQPSLLATWCARASLTIYLIHPAVMTVIVRGIGVAEGTTLLALLTTGFSLMIVALWETVTLSRRSPRVLFS